MSDCTSGTAALGIICPRCGAKVGQACQTTSGRTAPVHSARFRPLTDAFWAGYEDGRADERLIAERRGGPP